MRALEGIRILDLSRLVAGGIAGALLADFGADVVKVEDPSGGDPLRAWTTSGVPLWWKVYGRNKRYATLDLQNPEGRKIFLRLIPQFDVVMESFMPGTMERWGLGSDVLHELHPGLIMLRITGWGGDGPGADRPGFGTLVEAASGLALMTGYPDRPPMLPSFPLADMASGLYAVGAVMFALYHRDHNEGSGQNIDVSLFESMFSIIGPLAAEHATTGKVRSRQGNRSTNSGPRGCYQTSDGHWIAVSASTPKMAERFLKAYGLGNMLDDPRFSTNEARVRHAEELDAAIAKAIGAQPLAENAELIAKNKLTAHPVQGIAEIERDAHWQARKLIVSVDDRGATIPMHNVVPHLSGTPGEIRWAGGELGLHNEDLYCRELGLSPADLNRLKADGVI